MMVGAVGVEEVVVIAITEATGYDGGVRKEEAREVRVGRIVIVVIIIGGTVIWRVAIGVLRIGCRGGNR